MEKEGVMNVTLFTNLTFRFLFSTTRIMPHGTWMPLSHCLSRLGMSNREGHMDTDMDPQS